MKPRICQSCGLPFTSQFKGTNRDQTESIEYCIQCFQNGSFVEPFLSLAGVETKYLEMARKNDNMTLEEAREAFRILPILKRWRLSCSY